MNLNQKNQPPRLLIKPSLQNLFVLGDSLSDVGALVGVATSLYQHVPFFHQKFKLGRPYYQGRFFSSGLVAPALLSKNLGVTSKPAWVFKKHSKKGTNYAVGGARITKRFSFSSNFLLNKFTLSKQATALLKQHTLKQQDIIYINIGHNDFLGISKHQIKYPKRLIAKMIKNLQAVLNILIGRKARQIIVCKMSDWGDAPYFEQSGQSQAMSQIVKIYNQQLLKSLKKIQKRYPDIIKIYDLFNQMKLLRQKFQKRGPKYLLTNAATSKIKIRGGLISLSYVEGASIDTIDNYFYLDKVHPGRWFHKQLAADLEKFIKNQPFQSKR